VDDKIRIHPGFFFSFFLFCLYCKERQRGTHEENEEKELAHRTHFFKHYWNDHRRAVLIHHEASGKGRKKTQETRKK
jgi:hypothetical protein